MSLISCPSCQNQISNKLETCPHCSFSLTNENIEHLKKLKYRAFRDKMYVYKMLTFLSIAIAVIGALPMLWNYAKAIDYGFNVNITNHWGIFLVIIGFTMYVILRILMFVAKKKHQASR